LIYLSINLQAHQSKRSGKATGGKREAYREFFDRQLSWTVKRRKSISQYAWLLIAAVIGSLIWLYLDTVNKTTLSNQIAMLGNLGLIRSKDTVL
jgi:hypothetical protein